MIGVGHVNMGAGSVDLPATADVAVIATSMGTCSLRVANRDGEVTGALISAVHA